MIFLTGEKNRTIPYEANHQQQKYQEKTHQQWKRHELLGCSIQSPQAGKSTGKIIYQYLFSSACEQAHETGSTN